MTRTIIESKTKTTIIGFDQPFAGALGHPLPLRRPAALASESRWRGSLSPRVAAPRRPGLHHC